HTKNFTDLCNTTNNPVAFFIKTFVLDKVVAHVDERHTKDVVFTCWLVGCIVLAFSDAFCKICTAFQSIYKLIDLYTHLSKFIATDVFGRFRKHTLRNEAKGVAHAVQRLCKGTCKYHRYQ